MHSCPSERTQDLKLRIVATHPIQYHIPWFQHLAAQSNLSLKVYYALIPDPKQQGVGFNIPFSWDIPMLEGYRWELLPTSMEKPSLDGFFSTRVSGIDKVFRRDRPDAVILTGWQSFSLLQALWACKRLKIPCCIRAESNAMRKRPTWVRLLHRLLLSQYDAFLAIGKANKAFYVQYGIEPKRILFSPYFVDNDRIQAQFQKIHSERDKICSKWRIPKGKTCFLYAGKLSPIKGIMDLLRALALISEKHSEIHLLVVGSGELMAQAQQLSKEQMLPVSFAGFLNQTDITHAYAAVDCLVLPGTETWGLVVNEAMACGLPAIVSNRVGCWPDLVEEGVTGSIFPFGDVNALASKMFLAASDPVRLRKMGEIARKRVCKDYSVERAVEGTIEAIQAVVADRR